MEDLTVEMLCEMLSYFSTDEAMPVCSLWRDIVKVRQRKECINRVASMSTDSKACSDYELKNWH